MADPVTLTAIGLGSSLAGGLIGAKGASDEGAAQQQMYNYQAAVAKINVQIDTQNAEWARTQGEIQAVQYGQRAAQQRGQIIANQGASGIQVGSGSAGEVVRSQGQITQMDLAQIRNNAQKVAYDYDTKAIADKNQATLDVMAGANAKQAGEIKAASTLISTAGSVSSKWLGAQQAGVFGGGSGSIDLYGPEFTKVGTY